MKASSAAMRVKRLAAGIPRAADPVEGKPRGNPNGVAKDRKSFPVQPNCI